MLRECYRVLKPGGRIAGYVIHTPDGITPPDKPRAADLGPSEVNASASPAALAQKAGFSILVNNDVTEAFAATCDALLKARSGSEEPLRRVEGDDVYEEEQTTKRNMLEGIEAGLLRRCLIVAVRPQAESTIPA